MRARNSYLLAVLSGILLFLSYPPFNLGFLAWFALVPFLTAMYYETKAKRIDKLGGAMVIFLTPIFIFAYNEVDVFLPVFVAWPLGVIIAFLISGLILWPSDYWKPKQLPSPEFSYLPSALQIFVVPVFATAMEFLIMNIPVVIKLGGGFGFASISSTQWLNTPIVQLASFTGMYGITFLIWLVNCGIAYAIIHYKETRRISKQAIAILLAFGMILAYGWISIPGVAAGDTNVVIIQAKPSTMEKQHINELYANLTEYALKYEPEIILWSIWMKYEPFEPAGPCVDEYASFSEEHDVYLTDGDDVVFPDGKIEHHDAVYLFPRVFDGFVPFDLNKIFPKIDGFDTEFGKLGILVCMESASTIPARQLVNEGAQFIVTTSVERPVIGAFQGLIGGNIAYRAVEHRIYTALFFGDGGSIIVDPYGRIIDDIAPEPEIVAGRIDFTDERTFYSRYGDIFGFTIVGLFVSLLGYNLYLKRKSPYIFCKKCKAQMEKGIKVCPECGKKRK